MPNFDSARDLLGRWRDGDQIAAEALHRRFADPLCRLVEQRLGTQLARRVDPDDVVQSVFRTFFRRTGNGEYPIDHSGSLWRLLRRITLNKICRFGERHRAAKRDVSAEAPLDSEEVNRVAVLPDHSPEEVAELLDELKAVLAGFDQAEVHIIGLCLEGHSSPEIAEDVGCSRSTVRRVRDRVHDRLRDRLRKY